MQTTLLARIGASNRTSSKGHARPVKVGVPNGCSAISRAVISSGSPSKVTNATPSGLAIRPRRIRLSLVAVASAAKPGAAGRHPKGRRAVASAAKPGAADRHQKPLRLDRDLRSRGSGRFSPSITSLCEHGLMPTDPTSTVGPSAGRRWSIVVISLLVTASAFVFINGVAFLIPALEEDLRQPLAE